MAYVNVDVEVDLSAFDDDDILDAAVEIVRREMARTSGPRLLCAEQIARLRTALFSPDDDEVPLSTAAAMTSIEELRRYVESDPLFQFAAPAKDTHR